MAPDTVFEVAAGTHDLTTLVNFNFTDGAEPQGGLILAGGNLYGTTNVGGSGNDGVGDHDGTVFEVQAGSSTPTTLYNFNGQNDAGNPAGTLYMDGSGNIYGTAPLALFDNGGVVYEIPSGGQFTVLTSFPTDHGGPTAGLIADSQGNLYGSTLVGGPTQDGSIIELAAGSHQLSTLATFNGTDGEGPVGNLARDASGDLFGVTGEGGADNDGTVFEIVAGSDTVTTLATFNKYQWCRSGQRRLPRRLGQSLWNHRSRRRPEHDKHLRRCRRRHHLGSTRGNPHPHRPLRLHRLCRRGVL